MRVPELEKFVDDGNSIVIEGTFGTSMRAGMMLARKVCIDPLEVG